MAKAWSRKGNFFCSLWASSDFAEDFTFSQEVLSSYVDSEEFLDWILSIDIENPIFELIVEVRTYWSDVIETV